MKQIWYQINSQCTLIDKDLEFNFQLSRIKYEAYMIVLTGKYCSLHEYWNLSSTFISTKKSFQRFQNIYLSENLFHMQIVFIYSFCYLMDGPLLQYWQDIFCITFFILSKKDTWKQWWFIFSNRIEVKRIFKWWNRYKT